MTASDAYVDHYADSLQQHDQQRFYNLLTGRKFLPFIFKSKSNLGSTLAIEKFIVQI